jgi:hypothetical protein
MPYDIVGDEGDDYVGYDDDGDFVGADFVGAGGYDEVDDILSGLDIVGARARGRGRGRGAMTRGGRGGGRMGRHPSRGPQSHLAARGQLQAALQAKRAAAGLIFDAQRPGASRRLVLGMASTGTVAAGAIAQIVARPQNLAFKPQRIVIPSTIAPDFLITDIKVGNVSQLVQSGTLPAEAFTQNLFDGMMEMDTVQTSQDFVLQVQNIAGAPRNFNAAVYGLALLAR